MSGKYTVNGLPGVYNSTPITLSEGAGVALAVTQQGQLIVVNADGSPVGGSTEYTDGGTPPTHPKGGTIIFDNGGTWQHVSAANPLPVSMSAALSENLATINSHTVVEAGVNGTLAVGGNQASGSHISTNVNPVLIAGNDYGSPQLLNLPRVDSSGNLYVVINSQLASGGNNIGGVEIIDSGGTNKLAVNGSGQITISNSAFTANAGTNLNTSLLALESGGNLDDIDAALDNIVAQEATTSGVKGLTAFGAVTTAKPTYTTGKSDALSLDVNGLLRISLADTPANTNKLLVTPDSVALPANQSVNVSQINGVTPLMGAGNGGTGSLRVNIASDQVSIPVAATLSAETTKVIGTVNQGTSPWVISGAVTEATLDAAIIAQEATTSGVKGLTIFGAVTTNAPTYTTAKSDALSLDTSGLLRISLKDTPANTNKFLVTADPITFASAQSVNATLQAQTDTVMVGGVNIKEINAVTPLMGNGTTGTGSLRVTIASDNTAFAVNATLSAETTKVIGVTRTSDGAGNLLTSNSTTYSSKFGLDSNLLGTLGTAFSTAGKVDVKAADGDIFVRQATAANLNATVVGTGTFAVQATLAAETTKVIGTVRNLGNVGAIFDGVITAATAPANMIAVGGVYNSTELGPTNGQSTALQIDSKGRLRNVIMDGAGNTRAANVTANNELNVLPTQKDTFAAASAFTITLASLASSTTGVGRQSTLVTSNTAKSALIAVKFTVGTTPTINTLVYVYLIRGDGTLNDDNAGSSDAGLTVINAPLLGTILVSATTSNTAYYGLFDTKFLGSLGPTFGIAVVNSSGVTANATAGNFTAEYTLIT